MKNNEPQLAFVKEDLFYRVLRDEINSFFLKHNLSKKATSLWYIKAWGLIILYVFMYSILINFGNYQSVLFSCYAILGVLAILLGLNVGHDGAHGTISKKRGVNKKYSLIFDLLGGNSYIWRMRHIYAHHPYPNVMGYDSDIKQSKLVRIFPEDSFSKFHKYQHLYMPILLIFGYTINWFLIRDFQDFYTQRFGKKIINKHPKGTFRSLILFKLLYIAFILIVPILIIPLWKTVLFGFFIMNIFSGLVISIALISTHVGENHKFPVPNENGNFNHSWSEHQIATTSDFCTLSVFANVFFGGFNHHVIHHLFPEINHVHYVHLTPILKKLSRRYNINYKSEENLINVFKSHIQLLKREGWEHGFLHQEI